MFSEWRTALAEDDGTQELSNFYVREDNIWSLTFPESCDLIIIVIRLTPRADFIQ